MTYKTSTAHNRNKQQTVINTLCIILCEGGIKWQWPSDSLGMRLTAGWVLNEIFTGTLLYNYKLSQQINIILTLAGVSQQGI